MKDVCDQKAAPEVSMKVARERRMVQSLWKKCLAVPQNVKHRIVIRPNNFTLRYTPKRTENTRPHKNLYTNVHSGIIHSSHKVGINPNVHQLMNRKTNVVYSYVGTLS